jgi:hypothetical protein
MANIYGQIFGETLTFKDLGIYAVQPQFALTEAEFIHLISNPWSQKLVYIFLAAFIGSAVSILGRTFDFLITNDSNKTGPWTEIVKSWELWVLGISFLLILISLIIASCLHKERRNIIRKIRQHFIDNPVQTEIRKRT